MGRVIAIANQKGGVGKTTTTINLGAALVGRDRKVLLIDMDPQANCSTGLGIRITKEDPGIHHVMLNPESGIAHAIYKTAMDGLSIVPSHIDLSAAEQDLSSQVGAEWVLSIAIKDIIDDYDFVIIDTPPSLGLLSVNGLVAADSVIIPMEAEIYALEGTEALQTLIERIRKRLRHPIQILGVLITRYQGTTKIHSTVHEKLKSYWEDKIFKTVIRKNVDIGAAALASTPVIAMTPKSSGAQDYIKLAVEVDSGSQKNDGTG